MVCEGLRDERVRSEIEVRKQIGEDSSKVGVYHCCTDHMMQFQHCILKQNLLWRLGPGLHSYFQNSDRPELCVVEVLINS